MVEGRGVPLPASPNPDAIMLSSVLTLPPATPGITRSLTVQRFGTVGARPRAYIQASLHADEVPAMLVADRLRRRLTALEAEGRLKGEVVLVPVANPIGLSQAVLGSGIGRFNLSDGRNFNRDFPNLIDGVAERVAGRLGPDGEANAALIRRALVDEMAAGTPQAAAACLKHALLGLAVEADVTLDLHCDNEAVMHLYTLTPSAGFFEPLNRLLGVQAVFLATESGDDPFDEAVSRPWHELRLRHPDLPIPFGGHSATVELRGQADVDHRLADADAEAIVGFLTHLGIVAGDPPALPPALCEATMLESSEPIIAPAGGVVVFHHPVGTRLEAGATVADIVDPIDGTVTPVRNSTAGLLYARIAERFATPGTRIAKIAGTEFRRSGPLLSA